MEQSAVNTKLAINLSEGTVEVEGDEAFVRFIYQDFKETLAKHAVVRPVSPSPLEHAPAPQRLLTNDKKGKKDRAKPSARKVASGDGEKTRTVLAKPNFNSKLNVTGLADFYDEWKPENNSEKILVFAVFLRDRLKIAPCNASDIYTCFFAMKAKTKIPEAFQQAFSTAKHRTHFIEFDTTDSIEVTIPGDNWFTEKAKNLKEGGK